MLFNRKALDESGTPPHRFPIVHAVATDGSVELPNEKIDLGGGVL